MSLISRLFKAPLSVLSGNGGDAKVGAGARDVRSRSSVEEAGGADQTHSAGQNPKHLLLGSFEGGVTGTGISRCQFRSINQPHTTESACVSREFEDGEGLQNAWDSCYSSPKVGAAPQISGSFQYRDRFSMALTHSRLFCSHSAGDRTATSS